MKTTKTITEEYDENGRCKRRVTVEVTEQSAESTIAPLTYLPYVPCVPPSYVPYTSPFIVTCSNER